MSEENGDVSPENPVVNLLGLLVIFIVFILEDLIQNQHQHIHTPFIYADLAKNIIIIATNTIIIIIIFAKRQNNSFILLQRSINMCEELSRLESWYFN